MKIYEYLSIPLTHSLPTTVHLNITVTRMMLLLLDYTAMQQCAAHGVRWCMLKSNAIRRLHGIVRNDLMQCFVDCQHE